MLEWGGGAGVGMTGFNMGAGVSVGVSGWGGEGPQSKNGL